MQRRKLRGPREHQRNVQRTDWNPVHYLQMLGWMCSALGTLCREELEEGVPSRRDGQCCSPVSPHGQSTLSWAEMSSSALINALHRFVSIRGDVKLYRSDRGTNFVEATEDLVIQTINVVDRQMKDYLLKAGSTRIFNSPWSSQIGGAWERMIRSARLLLSIVLEGHRTHDVLATFMAEVSVIINNRPLVSV